MPLDFLHDIIGAIKSPSLAKGWMPKADGVVVNKIFLPPEMGAGCPAKPDKVGDYELSKTTIFRKENRCAFNHNR
jgi:hypothetical protein